VKPGIGNREWGIGKADSLFPAEVSPESGMRDRAFSRGDWKRREVESDVRSTAFRFPIPDSRFPGANP